MNHLDLFSGIGGFHLAGEMVWGEDFNTICHVEIDPFCQKVLKKHWPDVPIVSDIKDYKHDGTKIDLLTGGFPCQPFSCAGKRRGAEDDRAIWPEMLRVISEVRPTWIIGENVAGIVNMELEQVLSDLESEGYETQPFIIPACGVDAPHRRDRVWIVANRSVKNDRRYLRGKEERQVPKLGNDAEQRNVTDPNRFDGDDARYDSSEISQLKKTEIFGVCADTDTEGQHSGAGLCEIRSKQNGSESSDSHRITSNPDNSTSSRHRKNCGSLLQIPKTEGFDTLCWKEPWLEVAISLCRVDDGLPRRMDRVNRLKALGNAIVPQVVMPIMQAIKDIDKSLK